MMLSSIGPNWPKCLASELLVVAGESPPTKIFLHGSAGMQGSYLELSEQGSVWITADI